MGKPSFNDHVVKSLTKEQFLAQHPEYGEYWEGLQDAKASKPVKTSKPIRKK